MLQEQAPRKESAESFSDGEFEDEGVEEVDNVVAVEELGRGKVEKEEHSRNIQVKGG